MNPKMFVLTTCFTFLSFSAIVFIWSDIKDILEIRPFIREIVRKIPRQKVLQTQARLKQKHIYFLRTHKCGSTTIYSIFLRFGYLNNLTFVLPKDPQSVTISRYPFQKGRGYFLPPPIGEHYDFLCHHTTYNRSGIQEVMPRDTKYIGLVREPLHRFISAFVYYRYIANKRYLNAIGGNVSSAISTYLKNPADFEPKETELEYQQRSHTNNGMAMDFGFPLDDLKRITAPKIRKFISKVDSEFDLVIVLEYLDESLVMLKRTLNWSLRDILYLEPFNVGVRNSTNIINSLTADDRRRHRRWEAVDFALYNHFLRKLWNKILHEDESFHLEVEDFRTTRYIVIQFCKTVDFKEELVYTTKHLSEKITINYFDCTMLRTIGKGFTKYIKEQKRYPDVP